MFCEGCRTSPAIRNGDLTHGTGSPDYWQSNPGLPGVSILKWNHKAGEPGELEIENIKPNDSHWTQIAHLAPGWYLFKAEVRTENIPADHAGANLSSLEDGIISTPISGTAGWKTVGFYLRVGQAGADVPIACRLGGYSSPNTGKAWFRNITGTRVAAPSQEDIPRYDLDVIRGLVTPAQTAAAANPTRVAVAQPVAKPSATELPVKEVIPENAARMSSGDIRLEHAIDLMERAITVVLILATLFAGVRTLRVRLSARTTSSDGNDPSSTGRITEPSNTDVSVEQDKHGDRW